MNDPKEGTASGPWSVWSPAPNSTRLVPPCMLTFLGRQESCADHPPGEPHEPCWKVEPVATPGEPPKG